MFQCDRRNVHNAMAVKLSREVESKGFRLTKELVNEGKVVRHDRETWSEDQPSTEPENELIRAHGIEAFAKWHLNVVATQIWGGQIELLLYKATLFFAFR
jgi:hypothetical protein